MLCEDISFIYPMVADVYHPITDQDIYGKINKKWVFDRTVSVSLTPAGTAMQEDIKPDPFIKYSNDLMGRCNSDLRKSLNGNNNPLTNVLITNIRSKENVLIYEETSGQRAGKGTIYEIATQEPFLGPFGNIDYYKLVVRRSDNQGVDD